MAVGQQRNQQPLQQVVLADEHFADLGAHPLELGLNVGNVGGSLGGQSRHLRNAEIGKKV